MELAAVIAVVAVVIGSIATSYIVKNSKKHQPNH
jgi:hypothetical protein